MKNSQLKHIQFTLLFTAILLCAGCETEQNANNNGMVGYAQDHAKAQAEFLNQEQLKKSSLTKDKVVTNGSTQSLKSYN